MPDVLTLCGVPGNLGFTSLLFPTSLSLLSARGTGVSLIGSAWQELRVAALLPEKQLTKVI